MNESNERAQVAEPHDFQDRSIPLADLERPARVRFMSGFSIWLSWRAHCAMPLMDIDPNRPTFTEVNCCLPAVFS